MATRPVLRIFISSTATDLTGYRGKVRDAVLRLEQLPIAMETFSALGGIARNHPLFGPQGKGHIGASEL